MAKIFVKTGNFNNKGDMLMLLAVVQKYGDQHEVSVLPSACRKDIAKQLDIFFCWPYFKSSKKTPMVLFKSIVKLFLNVLPDVVLKRFGYVSRRNISLVLDVSGFAYSECWSLEKISTAVKMYASFKRADVVFMPQSYGPFYSPLVKKCMRDLVRGSPMICARDSSSYKHVAPLVSDSSNVYCFPDFTFDVEGKQPEALSLPKNYVVFLPSHRVADNIGHELFWLFYKNAFEAAIKCQHEVVILPHDIKHDFDVAERLRVLLGIERATVALDNVREIRWVVSESSLVVGSRFHGLVNALSQCVPAIGLGWTHKFDCLFEDYGVKEFLAKEQPDIIRVSQMVYDLLDVEGKGRREGVLASVRKNREVLRRRADLMWKQLDNIVG